MKMQKAWSSSSRSWILSLILGVALLVFALMGLFAPTATARIYGLNFDPGGFYFAKAVRDGMLAALLLHAVRAHNARYAMLINMAGIPIALADAIVVWYTQPSATAQIYFLHGGTVVALLLAVALIYTQELRSPARDARLRESHA